MESKGVFVATRLVHDFRVTDLEYVLWCDMFLRNLDFWVQKNLFKVWLHFWNLYGDLVIFVGGVRNSLRFDSFFVINHSYPGSQADH